jgi:ribonuclease HI
LPASQYGGRKGRTATDAIHSLVEFTKRAWRRKKEVILLFLDIKGAFPNVSIPVLVHDMRKMGFHPRYTRWITNKTTDCHTVLTFDDFVSPPFEVKHGLDQGCNLSSFLYNCYSAGQMEGLGNRKEELGNTYADDGVCGAWGDSLEEAGRRIEEMFNREGGPKDWGRSHHSIYELHKSGALALTRKRIVDPNNPRKRITHPPITIKLDDNSHITTVPTQKYLGVIVDRELRFKEQAAAAIGKGTRWAIQSGRLTKVAKGVKGALARRIYYGAAVASMLYAVDVWGAPPIKSRGEGLRVETINKMQSTQRRPRRAAIQATGGLRTTPTDLLFAHADMIPIKQLIEAHCHRSAIRLASLHPSHPLYKIVHRAASTYPKRHPSPLNSIMYASKITPYSMEKIDPRPRHPHWMSPLVTVIPPTKEDAQQAERDDEADVKIYTDGSGKDGHIGAAAILYHGFRVPRTARFHVGQSNKHTVFEGEGIGQLLGLKLLQNTGRNLNGVEVSMCVDSHAAIMRHNARTKTAAEYIFKEIHATANEIKNKFPNVKLKVRWTPGHAGIPGNEAVDKEAKKAADNPESNTNARFGILARNLPVSRSAHLQQLKEEVKVKYTSSFREGPRFHRVAAFDRSMPSKKFRSITARLPRRFTSILTQLRTNHIPLQAYLHRFKLVDSPICQQCFDAPETVSHFLFFCNKYVAQRL